MKTKTDFWLFYFCKTIFKEEVILVAPNQNPDILFCSCFGSIENIRNTKAKIKIFFTGENVDRPEYNVYSNEKLMNELFDLRLAFHFNDIKNNKLRIPLWLTFYEYYNIDNDDDNFIKNLLRKRLKNMKNKKILGSLVCRHDRTGVRSKLFKELSKYGKVESGGRFLNTGILIKDGWENKIDFISKSKYTICPENSKREGYCTEKIMHALEGGCIPLYWGVDIPEKDLLREESYRFINVENDEIMKNQVKESLSKEIKLNVFKKQSKHVLDNYYKTLEWQIKDKLNMVEKQKIYGISYASRHFKNRENIINNQGLNSNLFYQFKCFTEIDVDNEFKKAMGDIWNMSKRGGGYWVWKPYIIYKKLNELKENDILVYIDSGCSLNITDKSKKRFYEYIEMVNNHWTGFLRFRLGVNCKEKLYNNKYFLDFFQKRYNCDINRYIEDTQLLNGILIMRKTKFVMDFFNEHLKMLYQNPKIHTDLFTLSNEKHRHDQSVMSLLYKHMNGNLIVEDETWFSGTGGNGDFGRSKSLNFPIWATRYKN